MKLTRVLPCALVIALLYACSAPTIKTKNPEKLVKSLDKIEKSLEPEELVAFHDAIEYLTGDTGESRDLEAMRGFLEAYATVDGLTAKATVYKAWRSRVDVLNERFSDLETRFAASESDRKKIAGLVVHKFSLFPAQRGTLSQSVIELDIENRTGSRLFNIAFQVSLRDSTEIEPLVVEVVDRAFGFGLPPGQRARGLRVELESSDFKYASDTRGQPVVLCGVVRIDGRRNRTIASSQYGPIDAYLHQALQDQLDGLLAAEPEQD
jgi:hypothetical protein